MRKVIVGIVAVAVFAVLAGSVAAFTGSCQYYVGTGTAGCQTSSQGQVTSAVKQTSNFVLRDKNVASTSSMPSNAHLVMSYQKSDGTTITFECANGATFCSQNADSPWAAKAGCAISAPPPPRSITGYCRAHN
jgi:hypothetical protein